MRNRTSNHILIVSFVFLFLLIGVSLTSEVAAQAGDLPPTPDTSTDEELMGTTPKVKPDRTTGTPVLPMASGVPDTFGYTYSDSKPYAWIDATQGVLVDLSGDDNVSDPIAIGFQFPFYENSYDKLYITTNGWISFDTHSFSSFENREMPFLVEPQNLIAPFWDDLWALSSTGAKIYYRSESDRLTIAWHNLSRQGNTVDRLTFEAILYKNGDICYQYKDLNGVLDRATVGIEDAYGADGLTYLHLSAGLDLLEGTKQICFERPDPSYRVKILPVQQGGLVSSGAAEFNLEIINSGDISSDSYELDVVLDDPSWNVELSTASGRLLPDNDHDGRYETVSIKPGKSLPITATLYPPKNANIGSNTFVAITAYSQGDLSKQWGVKLHAAVPSSFVQGLVLEDPTITDAMYLMMVWSKNIIMPVVSPDYLGSTMGITYLPKKDNYLYFWEQNYTDPVEFTDLEFSILNGSGNVKLGPGKLTSNLSASTSQLTIADRSPSAAIAANGKIGLAWIRDIENEQGETQTNVFFAIYDEDDMSSPSIGPINITKNTGWTGVNDVPDYYSARIALTTDNRFVITWSDEREQKDGDEENIGFASYNLSGVKISYRSKVPGLVSVPDGTRFSSPHIVGILGNRVFLSFVRDTGQYTVGYLVLDSSGNLVKGPLYLAGQGKDPAAIQFMDGSIFLAWQNPEGSNNTQQVTYATLNQNTFNITNGPNELTIPFGIEISADDLSVTRDEFGNAVLTWIDSDIEQSIYYALVKSDGNVITPPIQIYDSQGKILSVSTVGASSAFYLGKNRVYLPTTMR